ncbi:MAG: Ferritin-like protein 2 [Candidatus Kapaibacterium sp.]|nr:MAG: Ferritin-like protein 2 [Candidatus Kapabacteria bacterium]
MLKETIQNALNAQLSREMYSSNLYLAMSGYFQSINLKGFAHWMRLQAQEETTHAMKFFDYMLDRGGLVSIGSIDAPPSKWDSPLAAMEDALKHEQFITQNINALADLAIKEGDHATQIFLQWFVTEQVEEESNVSEIVDKLKLIGDWKGGLLFIDNELAQRTLAPENSAQAD